MAAIALAQAQEAPASVKVALARANAAIDEIVKVPDGKQTFANTLGALDDIDARLNAETSLSVFMQNVSPDSAVRDQARAADDLVTNWYNALGKRVDLYQAIKAYADGPRPGLTPEQERYLKFTMRDYHLSGMDLPKEQRDRLLAIENEESRLGIQFGQNIADDETVVPLTLDELKGVAKEEIAKLVMSNGVYLVPMDDPSFDAVNGYATNPTTRQKTWLAYKRRGGQKNVDVLEQLLKLRAEHAKILGFKNHVDEVLATRMAKDSTTVAKFYAQLRPIVRRKSLADHAEFDALVRKTTGNPKAKMMPWDYGFYKNKLMRDKYAVDDRKVAEYFPMQATIDGLLGVAGKLYNISFKEVTNDAEKLGFPIWHPDVKLFTVTDNASGTELGHIYMDLFPRPGKYTHAACWGLIPRKVWADGTIQKPLAALVCNFTKPTADKPSLLPHDQVETLFHEFGHGLHNLLTEATLAHFSGTSVEQDFVEAPSQMFENWTWDAGVLSTFAKHYKTHQPLPATLLKGMVAARTVGSGLETEHQIYYGMTDQAFHTDPTGKVNTTKLGLDMYPQIELYPRIPGTMYQASFDHLVGYDGAYYGYEWSLVYAQDMFQRFQQLGLLSPKAGQYYREKVLSKGGTRDAMEMLKDYLGREPKIDAYLKYLGFTAK